MKPFKTYTLLFLALTLNCFLFSQRRITMEAGFRTLKDFIPELLPGEYNSYKSCGYCAAYDKREDKPIAGKGAYIQTTFYLKRIFIPVQLGVLRWNDNLQGRSVEIYYHPHAPSWWGPITNYREYLITYRSVSHYLNVSPGIGVNLLKPTSKFHLGPIIRFNPQFLLGRKEIENSVVEHYKNYQNYGSVNEETYSNPTNDAEDYIALKRPYKNHIKYNFLHRLSASAGISSSGILFRSFGYSVETGYQLQNFSRIAMGNLAQKSSFYLQLGVVYQLWNQPVAQ